MFIAQLSFCIKGRTWIVKEIKSNLEFPAIPFCRIMFYWEHRQSKSVMDPYVHILQDCFTTYQRH
jgi:hypothetical protein